jgi:ABC-2 type transport system ATP-binding protein
MSHNVIQLNGVVKKFKKGPLFEGLSLEVPANCVMGLLGKNGAGKTTLIKCVLGLIGVDSGEVLTLGAGACNLPEGIKARIGYVPQGERPYPWLNIKEVVRYTASFYQHWNAELVAGLIKDWELDPAQPVGLLSEGEAQKLAIILALGHEPELLIFDEPVASLDPLARRKFLRTILDIVSGRPCTVFFSTHITSDLERVADRVALLKDKHIDFCGGLDELKEEVKRIRIISGQALPSRLALSGLLRYEVKGSSATATVRHFDESQKSALAVQLGATIEVESLNLEEIFLELNA